MSAFRLLVVLALLAVALDGRPAVAAPAPPSAATSAPTAAASPVWGWPLAGDPVVARPFAPPPTPYAAGHRGVDLIGVAGQPVLSAGAGVVAFAGMVGGRPVVSIAHANGLRTTYEPVQPLVGAGQPVVRGSPLGVLVAGHVGCPGDACLHWGLRRGSGAGEVYLDPMLLLRPPRIRLLPWR